MKQENLAFRGQREGEDVLLLVHRHPWALAKPGLIVAVATSLIVLTFYWFKLSAPSVWTAFILGGVVLVYGLYEWFIWWNNLYLLTDQRVIVIGQRGLFFRRIEDYTLDKIQSVASDTAGLFGTLLNFGTVRLAIMGIKEPVAMPFVEDAYAIQEQILSAIKRTEGAGMARPKRKL